MCRQSFGCEQYINKQTSLLSFVSDNQLNRAHCYGNNKKLFGRDSKLRDINIQES